MDHWIVTANRLADGGVVYLSADRTWSSDVSRAALATSKEGTEPGLEWAHTQQREVCDPYVIAVQLDSGRPWPVSIRERIRAEGPEPTLRRLGYLERQAG